MHFEKATFIFDVGVRTFAPPTRISFEFLTKKFDRRSLMEHLLEAT